MNLSVRGYIIGMQYNLIPFKPKGKVPLYPILTKEGEEPQVNYLVNSKLGNITPFYLSLNGFVPACKESVMPLEMNKNNTNGENQGILYINPEGYPIGEGKSEERKIFVVYDKITLDNIEIAKKSGETFEFSNLTQNEAFEFPIYEIRQEIKKEIEKAPYEKDQWGNKIADFEIGGFIQFYEEWDKEDESKKIGSGFVNRMWKKGNTVKDNTSKAEILQEIDKILDPIEIANNNGREVIRNGPPKYSWHTHLNVFFDKNRIKRSYQWVKINNDSNHSKHIGSDFYSGERNSEPSQQDKDNIIHSRIGIVIDMVGFVHLYNNINVAKINESIFYNTK